VVGDTLQARGDERIGDSSLDVYALDLDEPPGLAIHEIVSRQEYAALGEDFEKKEHQLFGREGFEGIVERVGQIEKRLGIFDLQQFTPK
jgi:hypothetical protein